MVHLWEYKRSGCENSETRLIREWQGTVPTRGGHYGTVQPSLCCEALWSCNGWQSSEYTGIYYSLITQCSLVPRPVPSFSMLHAEKRFSVQHWKAGNGPGDEAKHNVHIIMFRLWSVPSWWSMVIWDVTLGQFLLMSELLNFMHEYMWPWDHTTGHTYMHSLAMCAQPIFKNYLWSMMWLMDVNNH